MTVDRFSEKRLMAEADRLAAAYLEGVADRRAFPDESALDGLSAFDEPLPDRAGDPADTLRLLSEVGGPATATTNGPNYFGFVIGACLPAAAAAERLNVAWDQCASSFDNAPAMATIERVAGRWLLDILDLPRESAVGFGTSATACGLACLATARAGLLARLGWDVTGDGLIGAPEIKVAVPDVVHITVKKALRLLGFGLNRLIVIPTDANGRVTADAVPALDDRTILCLQAGEVNTGEFDDFAAIIPKAKAAGAWVHVDGAFGLWARASHAKRPFTNGVEGADSWTTDGHKWLNTPYDGAVAICRDADLMARTMNADAVYATSEAHAQKNLTLEFSRRPRGLPIWAALRTLGRSGVEEMVDRFCALAGRLAEGCRDMGVPVLNRVVLNQVLCAFEDEARTRALVEAVQKDGAVWFGQTIWRGRAAFRLSVSSWRTQEANVDRCLAAIRRRL